MHTFLKNPLLPEFQLKLFGTVVKKTLIVNCSVITTKNLIFLDDMPDTGENMTETNFNF